jgi:hypothetical protein
VDPGTSTGCDAPRPAAPELDECDVVPTTEAHVEVEGISPIRSDASMPCTVDSTTALPDPGLLIELRCTSPERGHVSPTLRVVGADALPLESGDEVSLGFAGGGLFDEVLLTLRRPDTTLLLAWISAMWLPSADERSIPSAMFLEPLALALDPRSCGYECPSEEAACAFIEDFCPCTHRGALDVRIGDEQVRIVDGARAAFSNGFTVHVVHASASTDREGNGCGEGRWYQVLAIADGSG